MRVAFFLNNRKYAGIDWREPHKGNPGVGGTEYLFWSVSCFLAEKYDDLDILLLITREETMPSCLQTRKVSSLMEAVKISCDQRAVFVCDTKLLNEEILAYADSCNVLLISWSHCFLTLQEADLLAHHNCVVRHVCVSTEQRDRLRDHRVYEKSLTVHNILPFDIYEYTGRKTKQVVCFLGALREKKGFHLVAKAWSAVIKHCPQAELLVIGDGKLYDRNAAMGSYGIAKESYESEFIKYLINKDGTIKENVHFVGTLGGTEKIDMMKTAAIGVVNPRALDETFCLSAVEFEALGIPVVTARKAAYVETVKHRKTGMLFLYRVFFPYYMIYLLKNEKKRLQLGEYASLWVRERFSFDSILDNWHQLIADVFHGALNPVSYHTTNWLNDGKWLREINRQARRIFPALPSSLWYEEKLGEKNKKTKVFMERCKRKIQSLLHGFNARKK